MISYGTAGVGTGAGRAGPAQNTVRMPQSSASEEYDVFTNAGPAAAFRAPGHPQGAFALEQTIDELAEKLGMDALDFMDKIDRSPERREERRIGAEKFGWAQKRRKPNSDPGPVKRGVGVAQAVWYRINSMDSGCEVRIHQDGSVEALSAVQDIGGGIKTVIAEIVAEELGLQPRDITVHIGDTSIPPGPPSGGSMTTTSITPAVRNAAFKAKGRFVKEVASAWRVPAASLRVADGNVSSDSGKSASFKQAAGAMKTETVSATAMRSPEYGKRDMIFLGGVQFAEVAVDTETGVIQRGARGRGARLRTPHEHPRTGKPDERRHPARHLVRSVRRSPPRPATPGIMVNPNMEEYKIIGAKDMPEIEVHFIEDYLGAKFDRRAAASASRRTIPTALPPSPTPCYNATGVRMYELPMTPARVLAALGKVKQGGVA